MKTFGLNGSRCVSVIQLTAFLLLPWAGLTISPSANAQCQTEWLQGWATPGLLPNQGAGLRALVSEDPDGAGPLPTRLIAGGTFTQIDGTDAQRIAEWDGAFWRPIGTPPGPVDAIAVYNGDVYAAGTFGLRRLVGTTWVDVGTRLPASPSVRALRVFQNELYIAGGFTFSDGVAQSRNIARWDGTTLRGVDAGVAGQGAINALEVTPQGLAVVGDFEAAGSTPVASRDAVLWTGSQWQPMGPLPMTVGELFATTTHNGRLHVGGQTTWPDDPSVYSWNGATNTWTPIPSATPGIVSSLASLNGELIAAGTFTSLQGVNMPTKTGRWNGSIWLEMTDPGQLDVRITTKAGPVAVYNGEVVVAGGGYGDGTSVRRALLTWSGTDAWRTFARGVDGEVTKIVEFGDDVAIAGYFRVAGGRRADGIARFVNGEFEPMGASLRAGTGQGQGVNDLKVLNNQLYASGSFGRIVDGGPLGGIIRWNGNEWNAPSSPPPGSFSTWTSATDGSRSRVAGASAISPTDLRTSSTARLGRRWGSSAPPPTSWRRPPGDSSGSPPMAGRDSGTARPGRTPETAPCSSPRFPPELSTISST